MKLLLSAAVAALLIASPAMAQTDAAPAASASCGTVAPAPPGLPDGATASREDVEAYRLAFDAWHTATTPVLACKRTRAEEALARSNALTGEFNTENTAVNSAITAWRAEAEEFNARGPVRPRRDPRSVNN
jgi:hypothetical protein